MTQRARLLLLSGASLVGQNVLACLDECRRAFVMAATNSRADEPALFDFDAAYLTPEVRRAPEAFAARFDEVLAHFEPDLVIPCRDDDVSFLAAARERRPPMSHRFLCGDVAVALAMLDKLESAHFSSRHALPFAPTCATHDGIAAARRFAAEHGWPLIAKPRCGYASRGVRLILNTEQLEHACTQADDVLQTYIGDADSVRRLADEIRDCGVPLFHSLESTRLSIQAGISPDGSVAGVFASGNRMRQGRSERVDAIHDPDVLEAGRRWAGAFAGAGWRGPLNIQGQRDRTGAVVIYEYNGRFTGATAARKLLGFDEVGAALGDWLGLDVPRPAFAPADAVVRYPLGKGLDPRKAAVLLRDGYWQGTDLG